MVNPQTVAILKRFMSSCPEKFIPVERTILRGLLAEIDTLQGTISAQDQDRMHIVQRVAFEFSMHGMADTLTEMSMQDWSHHTPDEAILFIAGRIRELANTMAVQMVDT